MTLSSNFQNGRQCWLNPATHLKTMYTCQFMGYYWDHNILVENDIHFNRRNIFNCKVLIRPSSLHGGKSMGELHPPMCHVIWGCGIGIMIIFQLYYNQGNISMCHVIEEGHGILKFWLSFNYIITNGTLFRVTWAFVPHHQIILFDMAMCMVSKSWNYWFIENVSIWYCATWTLMLHTCVTHGILLFVIHPTYVKSS
jgi:hypothetical protein